MRLVFGFLHCRTDVWALGACLYSLAFLQNCFEEGSNLAILSRKYTIPEDNPYGEGLVELLDRMLCVDSKARADMTEVILCLSAVYSGRPLPPRKRSSKGPKTEGAQEGEDAKKEEKIGTFRTDSQGYQETLYDPTKATEGKKLASNSVAARRKRAAASSASKPPTAPTSNPSAVSAATETPDPLAFSSFNEEKGGGDAGFGSEVGFGEMKGECCMHALRICLSERHILIMLPSCLYRI
jgi:serine/threonine protein kinase